MYIYIYVGFLKWGDPKVMGFNILQCSNFGWLGVPPHFRKPPYILYIIVKQIARVSKVLQLGIID